MAVKLTEGEKVRISRAPTGVLEAYDLVLRGHEERKKRRARAMLKGAGSS